MVRIEGVKKLRLWGWGGKIAIDIWLENVKIKVLREAFTWESVPQNVSPCENRCQSGTTFLHLKHWGTECDSTLSK